MDPANIISRLRALKDASTRNQQYINGLTTQNQHYYESPHSGEYYQQHQTPYSSFFSYNSNPNTVKSQLLVHPKGVRNLDFRYESGVYDKSAPHGSGSYADFNSRLVQDFQARNQDLIDAQLERDHAHQIMTNILANMADYDDAELDERLANLNLTELHRDKSISNSRDIIKTIHLAPVANRPSSLSNYGTDGEESGPDIADISDQDQETIAEYIDTCYEHIIKVLKVYFILADGKQYRLPKPAEIRDIKTRLEGYIHVPDDVFRARKLLTGTRIYYLTVDDQSHIVLKAGLVYKLAQTGIIILDEIEKRKLDIGYSNPVFRKINNQDIAQILVNPT